MYKTDSIYRTKISKDVLSFINIKTNNNFTLSDVFHFTSLESIQQDYLIEQNIKVFFCSIKLNDFRFINKSLESLNKKIPEDAIFVSCSETFQARRCRIGAYRIPIIKHFYFLSEFIFLRLIPKVFFLKKIYFLITQGKKRLLSKAESLGRLISCGFEIVDYTSFDGILYVVSNKKYAPKFDMKPSYGPLFTMKRVGKDQKIINVYKLRTMHPYSEYLQNYMFKKYSMSNGDKIIDDFRISPIGSFLRKFWIDELPMIINLFKGDIKIFGVRPLSIDKFMMYPENAKIIRSKFKPGLIPPFYVDLPKSFNELIESEIKYSNSYEKSPVSTDFRYLMLALYNILVKGSRSK